ncbi:MAG: endolytic transglycosylase MltG [FCB group bacterium]|nr:endolytic transglycosylase MltG [FCB group bacterium]
MSNYLSKINFNKLHLKLLGTLSGLFIVTVFSLLTMIFSFEVDCIQPGRSFEIPRGSTVNDVAELLVEESCVPNKLLFIAAMRLSFKEKNIKAGRYTLKGIKTLHQLIRMITSPSAYRIKVTTLEGWTLEQVASKLEEKLEIDKKQFLGLCRDHNFVSSLGIDAPSLEGFLFPDTYIFLSTYTDENIIEIMVNQFYSVYEKKVAQFAKSTGLSRLEIVTLASIIQGESIYEDEMPTVSSVYYNRLKKKMKLQADPTIQYLLPKRKRRLYSKDLQIDSPYNTYLYPGLPPGPINNPGQAALVAAANPAETDFLYFVANGQGRHIFSRTNQEHINAKNSVNRK